MNRFLMAAGTATAIVAAMPAQAATPFTLTFDNAAIKSVETGAGMYGNSQTFTFKTGNETLNVKATAWHRTAVDPDYNSVRSAYLGRFTDANTGLGVTARNEGNGSGNTHTVDNQNGWDFIVFQFDKMVTLDSAVLNPFQLSGLNYKDNDAFVAVDNLGGAWNQTLNITDWAKFSAGFDKSINTSGDGVTARQSIDMSGKSGNMWIIGASMGGPDWMHDAFKIGQLQVTAVPEPDTWAMMLVGFGMVGAAARYRRRKTVAAIA